MPRQARQPAESSIYHVINRGAGRQIIFETDDDRAYFMKHAATFTREAGGSLLAWCLMDNHFHLLVRIPHEVLSSVMHRLQTTYAGYFNRVHERSGFLFENRFKSEPVNTEEYLLNVVRYIHENPRKAGVSDVQQYRWSSYGEYFGRRGFAQTEFVLRLFGGTEFFRLAHEAPPDGSFLDISDQPAKVTDAEALRIATGLFGDAGLGEIKSLQRDSRDSALKTLKEHGLGIRQIQRLTSVPLGVISRAGR